jgi:hypothetical protein
MQPHEERVVAERDQLQERLEKLQAFILTDKMSTLAADEQELLFRQCGHMQQYFNLLNRRIARFNADPK